MNFFIRSAPANCVQISCLGNSAHSARNVQLSYASYPASLPSPVAQPSSFLGCCATEKSESASSVVSGGYHVQLLSRIFFSSLYVESCLRTILCLKQDASTSHSQFCDCGVLWNFSRLFWSYSQTLVGVVCSCLQQSISDRRSAASCQEMSENH